MGCTPSSGKHGPGSHTESVPVAVGSHDVVRTCPTNYERTLRPRASKSEKDLKQSLAMKRMVLRRSKRPALQIDEFEDGDGQNIPVAAKSSTEVNAIECALRKHFLFASLNATLIRQIVDVMHPVDVQPGETVVEQGTEGDCFYVVESGIFDVYVREDANEDQDESRGKDKADRQSCDEGQAQGINCFGQHVHTYESGGSFGELALMHNTPRAATVLASADAGAATFRLWTLGRGHFRRALATSTDQTQDIFAFISHVDLLCDQPESDLRRISELSQLVAFRPGEMAIEQGEHGECFYLIKEGVAEVVLDVKLKMTVPASPASRDVTTAGAQELDRSERRLLTRLGAGSFFGERALLCGAPREASVRACRSAGLVCYVLDRAAFEECLMKQPLKDRMERVHEERLVEWRRLAASCSETQAGMEDTGWSKLCAPIPPPPPDPSDVLNSRTLMAVHSRRYMTDEAAHCGVAESGGDNYASSGDFLHRPASKITSPQLRVTLAELCVVASLGVGSFGTVSLVRHRSSGMLYALKSMPKVEIVKRKQQVHVLNERRIQAIASQATDSFSVRLMATLSDRDSIHMLLEFVQGGDVFGLLQREGGEFDIAQSRFVASCVIRALQQLHSQCIIFRDLKLENLMVHASGYIKLADFGFAKVVPNDRTFTLCGTPEYLAPELIQGKGYGRAVDYWALGVLLYEMAFGISPFAEEDDDSQLAVYKNIMTGNFQIPSDASDGLVNLLLLLLAQNPMKRLGNLKGGVNDIKRHIWFKPIVWRHLELQQLRPPIVPQLSGDSDISYFQDSAQQQQLVDSGNPTNVCAVEPYEPAPGDDWDVYW